MINKPVGVHVSEEVTDSIGPSWLLLVQELVLFSLEESHSSANSVVKNLYSLLYTTVRFFIWNKAFRELC